MQVASVCPCLVFLRLSQTSLSLVAVSGAYASSDVGVGFVFLDTYILSSQFRWQNITKLHWDNLNKTLSAAAQIFDWVIVVGDKSISPSKSTKEAHKKDPDTRLRQSLRALLKSAQVDAYISGNNPGLTMTAVRNETERLREEKR